MGPKWPFLLMYGSHEMRHTGFRELKGCQRDPRDSGRHTNIKSGLTGSTKPRTELLTQIQGSYVRP